MIFYISGIFMILINESNYSINMIIAFFASTLIDAFVYRQSLAHLAARTNKLQDLDSKYD